MMLDRMTGALEDVAMDRQIKSFALKPVAGALIQQGNGKRLRGSLAQQLAVQILTGELPAGHMFPGAIEYAEQLGISRSALREAVRTLSAKGLVDSRPKAGTRVSPRRQWSLLDPDLLAWQFEAEPSLKFLHDLFELRMIVEPSAAELAAERRTEDQVQAMRSALDAMARHGLVTDAGRLADQQFHRIMPEENRNDAVNALDRRSDGRYVGPECVSKGTSRW